MAGAREVRTVVLFPGALGDAVCFEPAARYLASDGPLTVYARGAAAEVLALFPCRPEVRSLDSASVARLFAPLEASERGRAGAPAWLAAFERVLSFTGSGSVELRTRLAALPRAVIAPFPTGPGVEHASDQFLRAASGDPTAIAAPARLTVVDARRESARPPEPVLALHPGSGGAAKRAPVRLFVEVAQRWRKDLGGRVMVVLGPAESREVEAWSTLGEVLLPQSVRDLATALEGVSAYLGNDSGPTHVAAALGLRGVALFSASEPARFGPRSPRFCLLRLGSTSPAMRALGDAHAVWSALSGALP